MFSFNASPFSPPFWMQNAHIQTLGGNFLRSRKMQSERIRLDTQDGDFVDVDVVQNVLVGDAKAVAILLHGLEGDTRRGYMVESYWHLGQVGIQSIGVNFRSCSGEMNRTNTLYHMGATDDLPMIIDWVRERYPDLPILLIGFSLGANVTLKFLGENNPSAKYITAGVAISPPFIMLSSTKLMTGLGQGYQHYLISKLKRKVRLKAPELARIGVDIDKALQAVTFPQFDNVITGPLHGYDSANDYYYSVGSERFIEYIQTPTLIIRALDDPFFDDAIPYDKLNDNPSIDYLFPSYGGHVGFLSNLPVTHHDNWAQVQLVHFLLSHLP